VGERCYVIGGDAGGGGLMICEEYFLA